MVVIIKRTKHVSQVWISDLKHRCARFMTSFSVNQINSFFRTPFCSVADTLSQFRGSLSSLSAGVPGWNASGRQQALSSPAGAHTSCHCSSPRAPLRALSTPWLFLSSELRLNCFVVPFFSWGRRWGCLHVFSLGTFLPPAQGFLIFFSWATLGLEGNHPEACYCPVHHLQSAVQVTSLLGIPEPALSSQNPIFSASPTSELGIGVYISGIDPLASRHPPSCPPT